jgi:hypothetical protein
MPVAVRNPASATLNASLTPSVKGSARRGGGGAVRAARGGDGRARRAREVVFGAAAGLAPAAAERFALRRPGRDRGRLLSTSPSSLIAAVKIPASSDVLPLAGGGARGGARLTWTALAFGE